MWDTLFDESMLDSKNVIVLCKTKQDAEDLFCILKNHGINWCGGRKSDPRTTRFNSDEPHGTCYHITPDGIKVGPTWVAEQETQWRHYTKCTFRGVVDLRDVDIPCDAYNILMEV